jgi:hypothetical protein
VGKFTYFVLFCSVLFCFVLFCVRGGDGYKLIIWT